MSNEAATPDGRRKVGAVEDTLRSDRIAQTETGCFTDEGAAAYLGGALDDTMRDTMRTHLDGCDACRALVLYGARAMGSSLDVAGETAPERARSSGDIPHRIGRFTILNLLGAGGMGVVYAAFDAQLDRKVALKLVRTELRDEKPEATRNAMLREAKAMAKVDHPNVITVFEVGTHEDQIFVAMELVTGGDLRRWLDSASRSWREILAVCRQAGHGLAAAHRAGLVHRDFKPDNVLVGSDSRVRVTDFGLARAVDDRTRPSFGAGVVPAHRPSDRLTKTGAIVGTPAYMAPEQHRGEAADARSDQFAFCVTMWEALYGQRPFAGDNYAEIVTNVTDGNVRDAPAQSEVPPRVREALRRGLRKVPSERWDEIDDLLAELEIETPRKRKLLLLAAVPIVIAAGVGMYLFAAGDKPVETSCPTAESKLTGVWDKKRREETRRAITEAAPFGADVASRTVSALDVYAEKWSTAWNEACAANTRGEQSPTMFDLRVACLMRRLHSVDAIASAFAKREPAIVVRARELVDGLAQIEICNNTESLARSAPPPSLLLDVAAIDELLAKSHALRLQGNMVEARKLAEQALADAERIKYRPSAAAALLTLAWLDQDAGDYAGAEKHLRRASTEAMSSSYDELLADILIELADVVGYELARPQEAHRLIEIARGALERIGSPPLYRIQLLVTESRIALMEGKHEPALAKIEEATAIVKEIGEEMQMIPILSGKGLILLEQGRFDDAAAANQEELELRAKYEGVRHPNYAFVLATRATLHFARNNFETGLADLASAHKVVVEALGPDSPELLFIENNTGIMAGLFGDWTEALRSARVVRAISEKQNGIDHPSTALAISNEGAALRELGRLAEAEPLTLQALDIRKRVLGEKHADYATSLTEVGELRLAQARWKEAEKLFADAEQILVETIGVESPLIPYATWGLGVAQLRLGDARTAKATLARTLQTIDATELDPILNSETRLALGDALWKLGEKARAKQVVTDTAIPLGKLPPGTNKVLRARIQTWLGTHR
ncbi:MAG: serine/threonine-protein kinase [Myxococcota bacterium]|nr:serine/threonine-protein kinase [Myxococcota bacterium]